VDVLLKAALGREARNLTGGRSRAAHRSSSDVSAATDNVLACDAVQAAQTYAGAIVDATFRHLSDRIAFVSAFDSAAPLVFVECQAPRTVLLQRARGREHEPIRVSDADLRVVMHEAQTWEPLDEIAASRHVVRRTDRPLVETIGDLIALLDQRVGPGFR
jgi:predicted kinase